MKSLMCTYCNCTCNSYDFCWISTKRIKEKGNSLVPLKGNLQNRLLASLGKKLPSLSKAISAMIKIQQTWSKSYVHYVHYNNLLELIKPPNLGRLTFILAPPCNQCDWHICSPYFGLANFCLISFLFKI